MRLFLDTSVLLAAAGSAKGASRFVINQARPLGWELVSSDYCAEEARRNLPKLALVTANSWSRQVASRLRLVRADVALDKPLVFAKSKDRPVVISALATRSGWLLTLDEDDFHGRLGLQVYGLRIASPGEFLIEQRALGRL